MISGGPTDVVNAIYSIISGAAAGTGSSQGYFAIPSKQTTAPLHWRDIRLGGGQAVLGQGPPAQKKRQIGKRMSRIGLLELPFLNLNTLFLHRDNLHAGMTRKS
ncbi:hypothetical protein M422DRAFT_39851 [Sphaerobolus stellatus SS14]|uniref:Uncharacterized protein n=1 Tax=Sphaerobolus stellatus (strain SS14) TaxID=990650 RepID=A0A0C9T2K0_SPHS4|nr:hypothetical protein M422DRAFT_39851 [Sphaerobolus stellatus SS14]